jgi:hypothetical protein
MLFGCYCYWKSLSAYVNFRDGFMRNYRAEGDLIVYLFTLTQSKSLIDRMMAYFFLVTLGLLFVGGSIFMILLTLGVI